jgi:hypothetical protein
MVVALRYVVPEALTNAAKHARASHVAVCGQSKDDILWLDTIDFCRSSHRQAAAICCWSRLEVDVTLEIGSPLGFSRSTQRLTDALLKRLDALTHEPPVSLYTALPVLADRIGVAVLIGCDS